MTAAASGGVSVAVDTGGTFTDVSLVHRQTGRMWAAKVPSTPADPSLGFINGIRSVLEQSGIAAEQVSHVFHGTTVATNAILEMKGAPAALLTTEGFRHVLEIGRHDIPRKANMYAWVKPQRPVPADRIFEIGGRLDAGGAQISPLDEQAVRAAIGAIRAQGIRAIAVCFLHSYADSVHEDRVRDIIAAEYPEAMVSLSSEILPAFREFERSMVTILNVYVMPLVSSYVARLGERLRESGMQGSLLLMKSNGGVTGTNTIRREPVHTALSGPAAGVVGAALIGRLSGYENLISIDIGGTSADICLISGGKPSITTEGSVGDWPLQLPMIDIKTIGAGGGSIARISESGSLTVGPESAGADPGPVCYGKGGLEPTVTDALIVLGHLPPWLLNGGFALDVEAARLAIEARIARPLGIGVLEAAAGILAVINNNMVGAIRVVSVERGHDPRDYALLAFGGAGPLHAGHIARLLGIPVILVPPMPGVLSSLGLLMSNLRNEFARTCLQRPPEYDLDKIATVFRELLGKATTWLADEGMPAAGREIHWQSGLRYVHQGYELYVPWQGTAVTPETVRATVDAFHQLHAQLYGFDQQDTPVEIVTLRVDAVGRLPQPALSLPDRSASSQATPVGEQPAYFGAQQVPCPVYTRESLGVGVRIDGPAIVQQLDCTTLLLPGQVAEVDSRGALIVRETGDAAAVPHAVPHSSNTLRSNTEQ